MKISHSESIGIALSKGEFFLTNQRAFSHTHARFELQVSSDSECRVLVKKIDLLYLEDEQTVKKTTSNCTCTNLTIVLT